MLFRCVQPKENQEIQKHVVFADKDTIHKERNKDSEETNKPGFILHSNDSATSDDTSDSSITINPSRSNEERRDLYETKYAREKPFHNSFCQNDKISTQHHVSRSITSTDDTSRDTANNKKKT